LFTFTGPEQLYILGKTETITYTLFTFTGPEQLYILGKTETVIHTLFTLLALNSSISYGKQKRSPIHCLP